MEAATVTLADHEPPRHDDAAERAILGAVLSAAGAPHAATVIVTLLWLPFGKLFHVFQRPAQLGVGFYKDLGARDAQAMCRRCAQPYMSRSMAHDLTVVEQELGFRYELPGGGHYQDVCPRCRRALFGLAQGALWRQYLDTRPDARGVDVPDEWRQER